MDESRTTVAVQQYLDELANVSGDSHAEPIVRELLGRAAERLHSLCANLLYRSYPRLTRGPLNLRSEEMLSAVVERMLKAMRELRPENVRQFFALANRHMRWELNDLARRLDQEVSEVELRESRVATPGVPTGPMPTDGTDASGASAPVSPLMARILAAIEELPEDEREVFNLVRIQGMTHPEAARVVGVSPKTIQRRLNRSLVLLGETLGDLGPAPAPRPESA